MVFMNYAVTQEYEENSFTGLFARLKRYQPAQNGLPVLAYENDDIKIMYQYSDDAIRVLLQGLQELGRLLGTQNKQIENHVNMGFFISAISNLIEALDNLRSDTNYMLSLK